MYVKQIDQKTALELAVKGKRGPGDGTNHDGSGEMDRL